MAGDRLRRGACALAAGLAWLLLADVAAAADELVPGFGQGRREGRAFRLYVPGGGGPARPLVVALHGCGQDAEGFARATRLNEAADRRGLLVLYPIQPATANLQRCWNWFDPAGRETRELLALVRDAAARPGVARDRIVVIGFSAGAFMAVNLVCAAPDVFTGLGAASGGAYRCGVGLQGALACMAGRGVDGEASAAACRASMGGEGRAVRASLWHGARDRVVAPSNLEALAAMLRRLGGASDSPAQAGDGFRHRVYRGPDGAPLVETWLVAGMGHAWSGGDPSVPHTYPPGPDATRRMLEFLLE